MNINRAHITAVVFTMVLAVQQMKWWLSLCFVEQWSNAEMIAWKLTENELQTEKKLPSVYGNICCFRSYLDVVLMKGDNFEHHSCNKISQYNMFRKGNKMCEWYMIVLMPINEYSGLSLFTVCCTDSSLLWYVCCCCCFSFLKRNNN